MVDSTLDQPINVYTRLSFRSFFSTIHALIGYYMLINLPSFCKSTHSKDRKLFSNHYLSKTIMFCIPNLRYYYPTCLVILRKNPPFTRLFYLTCLLFFWRKSTIHAYSSYTSISQSRVSGKLCHKKTKFTRLPLLQHKGLSLQIVIKGLQKCLILQF